MRQTDTQKLENVITDKRLGSQQKEVLARWVKHLRTFRTDSNILESAYTLREFGLFLKKPYEYVSQEEINRYLDFKKGSNESITGNRVCEVLEQSVTAYRYRIIDFYRWMTKHTNFTINPDLAYPRPKLVIKERKSQEEIHRIRALALLNNKIITTNRKEDRNLSQSDLNAKYTHLLLDPANLKILNDYYKYKVTSGKVLSNLGFVSKLYLIKRLGLFLKGKSKTFKEAERDDIQDFLAEVQIQLGIKNPKAKINSSYKAHLLDFYRFVYGIFTEEQPRIYPPVVSWLYQKRKKSEDRVVKGIIPDIEIKTMLDACAEVRDKALFALLVDSSARVGEIVNTNIGDLKINEINVGEAQYSHFIATITLRGKTGERTNQLFYSVPHLRLWLMNHPLKDKPDAPLFIATKGNRYGQRICPVGINKILQRAAVRARIPRHIHAHLFRHTNLTRMAKLLSETELKIHAGWGMDSNMATVYVHLNEKDVAEKILASYGIMPKESTEQEKLFEQRLCPNTVCSYQNPPESKFCLQCGYPLTLKTALNMTKVKQKEDELQKELFQKPIPSMQGINDMREAMYQVLKTDPELVEKLKQIFNLTKEVQQ